MIRIRTFLPKINTPILEEIKSGKFKILSAHEIIKETYDLVNGLEVTSMIYSDHYTNYIQINGKLPEEKDIMLSEIKQALNRDESCFRDVYIGTQ
jgi:hypothetical protein